MSKIIYLTGDARWAQLDRPDDKYGKYVLNLYMDKPSWQKFKDSGSRLEVKEDKEGVEYVKFSRPSSALRKGATVLLGPPEILTADGEPYVGSAHIGNGSNVTIKIDVYDTVKGPCTRLERVRINKLIEYHPPEIDETEEEPF